ncbi:MAG TPA: amidohydrolase family protein, partial [Vicinamibacterales bacterium]
MRRALASVFATLLIGIAVASGRQAADTDIAIVNARVFTGVEAAPWAEALRIEGDRITLVGTSAAVRTKAASSTRIIDAGGRLVIPGINDAHAHPGAMPAHTALDAPPAMMEDPSWTVTLERVKAAVEKTPAGGWIIGEIGGVVLDDPAATRFALDPITGDRPVMLASWHGHGTIFNTAALRRLGASETEPDPPGGLFARAADGRTLTGLAHEYADYRLRQRLSMLPPEAEQIAAFQRYAREAASFGITSVQAMMTGYPAVKAAPLIAKAGLPVRMRLIDFPMNSPAQWWGAVRGPESPKLTISGVKYVLDGTPIE